MALHWRADGCLSLYACRGACYFLVTLGTTRLSSSLFCPDSASHTWNLLSTIVWNSFLCSLDKPASFIVLCQLSIWRCLCATARWYLLGRPPGIFCVVPSISNGMLKVKKSCTDIISQTGVSARWSGPTHSGWSHMLRSAPMPDSAIWASSLG